MCGHLEAQATVGRQQHPAFQVGTSLLSHLTLPWRQKFSTGHSNVCRSKWDTSENKNTKQQNCETDAFSRRQERQKVSITRSTDLRKRAQTQDYTEMFTVETNNISLGFEAFSVCRQARLRVRKVFLSNLISRLTSGECRSSIKTKNYYFLTINAALNWVTADVFTKHFFNMKKTKSFAVVLPLK